jgi:tRNA(fMet)-specific endonuclease VapC
VGLTRLVGVIDTNVVIALVDLDVDLLPVRPLVSTVTLAELAVGPRLARSATEREARLGQLDVARGFESIPFDGDAAVAFGQVALALHDRGRKVEARSYDALIAATALSRQLPLYTCNADDFAGIEGLEVVAVPQPGAP